MALLLFRWKIGKNTKIILFKSFEQKFILVWINIFQLKYKNNTKNDRENYSMFQVYG